MGMPDPSQQMQLMEQRPPRREWRQETREKPDPATEAILWAARVFGPGTVLLALGIGAVVLVKKFREKWGV